MRVDWVGELATESITLCGGANEDSETEQTLCPHCAQVRDALNFCGLGPESLRGHCQRKVARTEFSTDDRELGRPELTPLGECGGAVELEIVS